MRDDEIILEEVEKQYKSGGFWNFMDYEVRSLQHGSASLQLQITSELNNIKGTAHGGVYAAILDTTMGMTVRTLRVGEPVTIQMNIQFIKAAINEKIYTVASVISNSNSTFFVKCDLFNSNDELISFSTGSFKIV